MDYLLNLPLRLRRSFGIRTLPPETRQMVFEDTFDRAPGVVTMPSDFPPLIAALRSEERINEDALHVFCKEAIFRLDSSNNWELRGFSERELSYIRKLGVKLQFAEIGNLKAEKFVASVSMIPNIEEAGIDCEIPDYCAVNWLDSFLHSFPDWFAGFKSVRKITFRFPWLPKSGRNGLEATIDAGLKHIYDTTGLQGKLISKEETRETELNPAAKQMLEHQEVSLKSVLKNQETVMRVRRAAERSHFRETWVWEAEAGKKMDFSGLREANANGPDTMMLGGF